MWALSIIFSFLFVQILMNQSEDRIDGGHPAKIQDNPHVCYVTSAHNEKFVSIATILDNSRVLTSFRPASYNLQDFKVTCGAQDNYGEGDSYNVQAVSHNFPRKLAVMLLDKKITYDLTKKPIPLSTVCENNAPVGGRVVSYDKEGQLAKKIVNVVPDTKCKNLNLIPDFNPEAQTCAITQKALQIIDAGTGLVIANEAQEDEDLLFGIFAAENFDDTQVFRKIGCAKAWIDKQFT